MFPDFKDSGFFPYEKAAVLFNVHLYSMNVLYFYLMGTFYFMSIPYLMVISYTIGVTHPIVVSRPLLSNFTHKEKRNRSGARVSADGRTNMIDQKAVDSKSGLYLISDEFSVL